MDKANESDGLVSHSSDALKKLEENTQTRLKTELTHEKNKIKAAVDSIEKSIENYKNTSDPKLIIEETLFNILKHQVEIFELSIRILCWQYAVRDFISEEIEHNEKRPKSKELRHTVLHQKTDLHKTEWKKIYDRFNKIYKNQNQTKGFDKDKKFKQLKNHIKDVLKNMDNATLMVFDDFFLDPPFNNLDESLQLLSQIKSAELIKIRENMAQKDYAMISILSSLGEIYATWNNALKETLSKDKKDSGKNVKAMDDLGWEDVTDWVAITDKAADIVLNKTEEDKQKKKSISYLNRLMILLVFLEITNVIFSLAYNFPLAYLISSHMTLAVFCLLGWFAYKFILRHRLVMLLQSSDIINIPPIQAHGIVALYYKENFYNTMLQKLEAVKIITDKKPASPKHPIEQHTMPALNKKSVKTNENTLPKREPTGTPPLNVLTREGRQRNFSDTVTGSDKFKVDNNYSLLSPIQADVESKHDPGEVPKKVFSFNKSE